MNTQIVEAQELKHDTPSPDTHAEFVLNGRRTSIDPHSAWAGHIEKEIERCRLENTPYTGPLPLDIPAHYYTCADAKWQKEFYRGKRKEGR